MRQADLKILILTIVWFFFGAPSFAAEVKIPDFLARGQEKLTIQEKWVLEKLSFGEEADLKKFAATKPDTEEIRILRARFIETLLTDGFPNLKIHWHGIKIRNADIVGDLNLEGGEIPFTVKLYNCFFTGKVNMNECRFKRSLWIFTSFFQKNVDGLRIEIEKNCYFNGCIFNGSLNLAGGRIGREFSLIRTWFCQSSEAKFEGMEVGTNMLAHDAIFTGEVNFFRATAGGNMEFNDATFYQTANINEIKINGKLGLHRTIFIKEASFARANVGQGLLATKAKFLSESDFASFNDLQITILADFTGAWFFGPVNFDGINVSDSFIADDAVFEKELHANGLTVRNIATFQRTIFNGPVGLADAEFGGQINLSQARFTNEMGIEASGLKVGQLAKATETFFAGPLNFQGARIGGEFRADLGEQGTVLEGGIYLKEVILSDAQLSDLKIQGAPNSNLKINNLNVERMIVNRDLILQDIEIGDLIAPRIVVKGQTEFNNVIISQKADLQNSSFLVLKFSKISWPNKPLALNLSGVTYQSISGESIPAIFEWLNNAVFDTRNYTTYQTYLERSGEGDWADEAYIKMKRREWGLQTWKDWLNPVNWPVLLLWDLPVGYGRRPQNIFWYGLPFIILGAIVFDPKYLHGISWPQKNKFYNAAGRLLLSVDKFTPKLLEFGLDEHWQPPELSSSMQLFLHIFRLMGKIFISIFFIAIFARFK